MSATQKATITIEVELNEEKIPAQIWWKSDASPEEAKPKETKAMLVSFFDKETLDTLKIDLWTTEMQVVEMDRFIFQTLRSMADTYFRATKNNKLASEMQQFVQYFGEQTEIIPKQKP